MVRTITFNYFNGRSCDSQRIFEKFCMYLCLFKHSPLLTFPHTADSVILLSEAQCRFFASKTITWLHYCSRNRSGCGRPEAVCCFSGAAERWLNDKERRQRERTERLRESLKRRGANTTSTNGAGGGTHLQLLAERTSLQNYYSTETYGANKQFASLPGFPGQFDRFKKILN